MKRLLICLCTSFALCGSLNAQSDIQAMLKQIAKLEIYIIDLEKGYKIAREGLTTIGEIKKGEFNLHSIFFSSLQSVNPGVAKYSRIAVIVSDQISIVSAFKILIQKLNGTKINSNEINYINTVYSNILTECTKSMDALIAVTTDGNLEMTDDERIKRIDGIYEDMEDKYAFTQSFCSNASQISVQRNDEADETTLLKSLE